MNQRVLILVTTLHVFNGIYCMNPTMMKYGVFADIYAKSHKKAVFARGVDSDNDLSVKSQPVKVKSEISKESAEFPNPFKKALPSFSWSDTKLLRYQFNVFLKVFLTPPQYFFQSQHDKTIVVPPIGIIGLGLGYIGLVFDYPSLKVASGAIVIPPLAAIGLAEVIKQINKVI